MSIKEKKPLHEIVARDLIDRLEKGTAPWQRPWVDGQPGFELPYNAITGNRYKGINMLSLLSKDREDPRWMTFNQATANGFRVKRGEKASLIQFVKVSELVEVKDERGKPLLDGAGKATKMDVPLIKPIIANAWVFNAVQIENIEPLVKTPVLSSQWEIQQRAENLISSSGADIVYQAGNRAFYSPISDKITMPLRAQFDSGDSYYATLLHELGHWTGHPDRLDRGIMNTFGTQAYAREELRAEIASMLIGQELNIGHDPNKHASYLQSWIKLLREKPLEILTASADAEKIAKYLLAFEHKREIKVAEILLENKNRTTQQGKVATLTIGDQIAYGNTSYKVLGHLKRGRLRVEDINTGNIMALSKTDGLYGSLVNAKSTLQAARELSNIVDIEASPKSAASTTRKNR